MSPEDDRFSEIASSLPDLAALDDGLTVTVSGHGMSVSLTRVDYEAWVQYLTEHILSRPRNWRDGIAPFADQPSVVHEAVVHESYLCLAEVAFECGNLLLVPELFATMNEMILYCRSLSATE